MKFIMSTFMLLMVSTNGFAIEQSHKAQTEEWIKLPVESIEQSTEDEIIKLKTPIYDVVELDCRGIFGELNFVYNAEIEHKFRIDNYRCQDMMVQIPDQVENSNVCVKLDVVNEKFDIVEEDCH